MDKSKIKKLDDKAYEEFIKEMSGGEEIENLPTQKKDWKAYPKGCVFLFLR